MPRTFIYAIRELFTSCIWNPIAYFVTGIFHFNALRPVKQKLPYLPGIHLFAINSLFWMTASNEMKKSGLRGKSSTVGDGQYDMANWWFYSPLSLHVFRSWGVGLSFVCITLLPIGMMYVQPYNCKIAPCAIIAYFAFPVSYSMAFVVGRYHSIAWLLFPVSIASSLNHDLEISTAVQILIAFTSTTVWAISSIFTVIISIVENNKYILMPQLISCFCLLAYLTYIFWGFDNLKSKLASIMSGIGLIHLENDKKYIRRDVGKLSLLDIWYMISCFTFIVYGIYIFQGIPYLISTSCTLLFINSKYTRFADTQTLHFLIIVTALIDLIRLSNSYFDLVLLIPFTCCAYLHKTGIQKKFGPTKIIKPIDLNPLIEDISTKLKLEDINNKLYIPFNDPNWDYAQIFNGYRHCIEPIIYAGSYLGINVFPNWFLVFNGIGHELRANPWADDTSQILQNLTEWSTEYALVNIDIYGDNNELCNSMSQVSKYTYDTHHFDAWSSKHFKKPNWILYRLN